MASIQDLFDLPQSCGGSQTTTTTETLIGSSGTFPLTNIIYETGGMPPSLIASANADLVMNTGRTLGEEVADCIDNGGSIRLNAVGVLRPATPFDENFIVTGYTISAGGFFTNTLSLVLGAPLPTNLILNLTTARSSNIIAYCTSSSVVTSDGVCFAGEDNGELQPGTDLPMVEEVPCEQWLSGLNCESGNLFGKINWLFNKITCAIKSLSDRVDVLESAPSPIVDLQFDDMGNAIEIRADGSQEVTPITDYFNGSLDTDQVQDGAFDPITGLLTINNEDGSQAFVAMPSLATSTSNLIVNDIPLVRQLGQPTPNVQAGLLGDQLAIPAPFNITFPASYVGRNILFQVHWNFIAQGNVDNVDIEIKFQYFDTDYNEWFTLSSQSRNFNVSNNGITTLSTYNLPSANVRAGSNLVNYRIVGETTNLTVGGNALFFDSALVTYSLLTP